MKYLIFALLRSHKSEKCLMDLNLFMTGFRSFVCELKIQIRFLCNYDGKKAARSRIWRSPRSGIKLSSNFNHVKRRLT